jgi:hypothetical protein
LSRTLCRGSSDQDLWAPPCAEAPLADKHDTHSLVDRWRVQCAQSARTDLRDFENEARLALGDGDLERVKDGREIAVELNVDDGADDLGHLADRARERRRGGVQAAARWSTRAVTERQSKVRLGETSNV